MFGGLIFFLYFYPSKHQDRHAMKRFLLIAIFAIICTLTLSAQEPTPAPMPESRPVKEFLPDFTAIKVDAPIKLTLKKIAVGEAPYIIYNTKGVYTSKFVAEVDRKSRTLKINERSDPKRESITEVEVYFTELSDISISKADAYVDGVLTSQLIDIYISNDANFVAEINSLDLMVYASGQSRIQLKGCTHYQTAEISTAEYDARGLETISTRVESSHNATVKVDAVERLEAKTTTGGKVYYLSHPVILRSEITLFGGEIQRL